MIIVVFYLLLMVAFIGFALWCCVHAVNQDHVVPSREDWDWR